MEPAWLLVALCVTLIGVTKSGFGSGVGLMIVPATAIAFGFLPGYGSAVALGFMLPLLIAGDLIAVWQYRTKFDPKLIRRLLPGSAVGIVLGGVVLLLIHRSAAELTATLMRLEIALESILLVSLHWWRQARGVQQHLMPEPWRSHLTGATAGASSTLAHAAGPIVAMYLLPLKLDRQIFVGTTAFYFFIVNTAKLPAFWSSGQFSKVSPLFSLAFLPLVLIGAAIGFWINRRMSDKAFASVVYFVTFALGIYLLIDSVIALSRQWP